MYKSNPAIQEYIKKAINPLEKDQEIKGLDINKGIKSGDVANISKDEFPDLLYKSPFLKEENSRLIQNVHIFIKVWDFLPNINSRLTFFKEGKTISPVYIKDENFLEKISVEKPRLGANDAFLVDLFVNEKFDYDKMFYVPTSYEIVKVHEIILRNEQSSLFE